MLSLRMHTRVSATMEATSATDSDVYVVGPGPRGHRPIVRLQGAGGGGGNAGSYSDLAPDQHEVYDAASYEEPVSRHPPTAVTVTNPLYSEIADYEGTDSSSHAAVQAPPSSVPPPPINRVARKWKILSAVMTLAFAALLAMMLTGHSSSDGDADTREGGNDAQLLGTEPTHDPTQPPTTSNPSAVPTTSAPTISPTTAAPTAAPSVSPSTPVPSSSPTVTPAVVYSGDLRIENNNDPAVLVPPPVLRQSHQRAIVLITLAPEKGL